MEPRRSVSRELSLWFLVHLNVHKLTLIIASLTGATLDLYNSLTGLAKQFANSDDDGLLLADYCEFKRGKPFNCNGGLTDFISNDGSRRLLEMQEEMEEVFPLYDLSGLPMSASQSRFLSTDCTANFSQDNDCAGSCSCSGLGSLAKAKCKGRELRCKGTSAGISFPFMSDPASILGLLSGGDIDIME